MEDTQAINWEVEEEEETERPSDSLGSSLEPLGRLHIFSSVHGPEKDFPLYLGKNVVGRMPDCTVALPFSTISKQHAVIEILAWNKAPILRDCGSLNGTQILRPPKFLSPGVSHRLRNQELVVFADLPCQYHRLDVSLPYVSWGPLTVQETPRVQGGTQPWGNLLAEDSEEEVDPLSERYMVKEPRTTFPILATVVPESDEEGPSSAPHGPEPPCAFNLDSDTDEEESPQPVAGEACSAATRDATAEKEQPKAVATEIQCEMNQYSGKERNNDTRAKRDTSNGVVPVGMILERSQPVREDSETDVEDESRPPGRPAEVHLERAQPCGFIDSDTDLEEEIPATPAVVPVKKRQIFHGVSTESLGGPDLAHLQESLAGSDTDVETEAPLTVPLVHSQASMVINSNTDDEEEVSAALTLARLKESHAAMWNRDIDAEEDQAQPLALLEQSQTSSGRDGDTEVEKEKFPVEKREYVPKGHTDKAHSEKSQPPFEASVREVEEDKSSPGVHLEISQASAKVGISIQVEEEIPPGSAVILPEKHQVPVAWTNQTNVEAERGPAKLPVMNLEEARPPPGGDSEADADKRKSQFPTEGVAGTEWVVSVPQQEGALEAGAQGEPPVAQVEQGHLVSREKVTDLLVDTGTPGEPTQPQRKRAQPPRERGREPHVDTTKDSEDNHDDSENLDLQATQCFVERENQSMEGALDEPWEVLATQSFCLRESEASDTQPIAAHLEAHGSCPFSPRATPQDQHPESPFHAEPLEIQGRGLQTAEKGMSIPRESAERVTLEGGPLGRETKKLPLEGLRENVMGEEELTRVMKDREQKQVLARDTQRQESNIMVKRDMERLKVEIKTPKELQEMVKQALAKEVFEREAEKPAPEKKCEPGGLEVSIPKVILEGGTQRLETKRGSMNQKGQATSPILEPAEGAGDLMGLSSALIASGSQSGGRRGAPLSHERWQRGHLSCKMTPAERLSRGDPESLDACVPPTVSEASVPGQNPLICQNQEHPAPQPLFAPSLPFLEPPIPRSRQNGSQEILENPLSLELDTLHEKPKVRPRGCSRMASSPVSSISSESHPPASKDQPATPEPTSRATRSRTQRSSVKTPKPVVPTASELQPSTSKDQPVTSGPTSRATRSRTQKSSVKTPEPFVPTASELQPSTSKDQPVTPGPTSRATRSRTQRSSVKTPEPVVPTASECQPSTSKDQPVTPEPTSRATRSRTQRSSVKTPEPVVPTASECQPSTSKDQPITSKVIAQSGRSRTLRTGSAVPVPATTEFQSPDPTDQPISPESIPQANCSRRPKASRKNGSLTTRIVYEPSSALLEPNFPFSRNQRRGAVRVAKSLAAIPKPAFAQLPETPTHVSQIQKVEAGGRYEVTSKTQPKAFQNRKRPFSAVDSPPLRKRLQRGEVHQKTVFLKEEEDSAEKEEDVVIPGPGKREKDQAEEAKGVPGRSLRRTKPKHESTAPKVLFTGVVDARGEQAVLALGGSLASSVTEASHLVTDRICRTVKFLCALGRGIPILSLDWLHQSHKAGCFLPPDEYVVTDSEQEKNFGFSLRDSLSRARQRRLLEGYEIHVTPGVQPPPPQMAEIISCCGGTVLPSMPRSYKPQRVVITCSQDVPRCNIPIRVGLPILSPEFLLTGVLKQEAKPEAFVLSTLEMSCT
ncbi:mediator of DNA damage checkpoint protein 1 isoform X2 [Phyllostomus hastatus]|nr:mediator of DNA damage checkpoint protein 1 isoform X2 [Phyllostomus hastatus]XP_045681903.1 mediator of DNA damage checkpoint protein 1 isoform X2 [Phyllostomus hastatus]XP_045681904.1 mediator of DNA damage checkpoint protein 1 isoform X2 [Phyllostomus hastatus]XP_045681906.1 mediator of DNA damage checkpoint protein 1 isoform X2 [Phyllostomus hastatus]XP_045681907.1 mediator of DNA damage checkpoint protein 1 isoform X2 [Phyllostomus hastatus]